jgi:hypothetical protein
MAKAKKRPGRHRDPELEKKELLVEIFGVTMILPKQERVVIPNGVKARLSMNRLSAIPPHVAFIAFELGTYQPPPNTRPALTFFYDLVGDGEKETRLDAFLLNNDKVTFEGFVPRDTKLPSDRLVIENIPTMAALSNEIEICPGVVSGSSTKVIASIDLSQAKSIKGEDHGDDKLPVTFGTLTQNWAEKIVAEFERNGVQPRVALTKEGQEPVEFNLKENATRVMIANVPAQEVMKLNDLENAHDHNQIPLAHIELLYDFFHMPCGCDIPAQPMSTLPAHIHNALAAGAAAQLPGSNRCGPPLQG